MAQWIISSSTLILAVILLRRFLRGRISLILQYALWGIVLIRLLVPFSFFESGWGIFELAQSTASGASTAADTVVAYRDYTLPDLSVAEPDPHASPAEQQVQYEQNVAEYKAEIQQWKEETGTPVTAEQVLVAVWYAGMAILGVWFIFVNLRFNLKLCRSREKLDVRCVLRVYRSGAVITPCLAGLFRPAIYLTPESAENEETLRHVTAHELTHYRHGDHIWAVLRCVCLVLHWYNPLVWWAASLSRCDCELACDEGAIRCIGEAQRAAYGKTLISLTCSKRGGLALTATTMTGGKKSIKERIALLAKHPKTTVLMLAVVIVAAIALAAVAFTTGKDEPDVPQEVTPPVTEPVPSPEITENVAPEGELIIDKGGSYPLYKELEEDKLCLAVMPTGISTAGGDYRYLIPEEQEKWVAAYDRAMSAMSSESGALPRSEYCGFYVVYEDKWLFFSTSGALYEVGGGCANMQASAELYELCLNEIKAAGLNEPVRPADIEGIVSATLNWRGEHTITDERGLAQIETWLSESSQIIGGSACYFTALLTLELESGESITVAMATDSCTTWHSEGVYYEYSAADNAEFYALFAAEAIHDVRTDPVAFSQLLPYLDWSRYANLYGTDKTFALMDILCEYTANGDDGIDSGLLDRLISLMSNTRGLDGAYADYFSSRLNELWEEYPEQFAWACLGSGTLPHKQAEDVISMLAYNLGISEDEMREMLTEAMNEADRGLSWEELNYFREFLTPIVTDENGMSHLSYTSCFLTSYYEDTRNINFAEFIRYFPYSEYLKPDLANAEYLALSKHELWFFDEETTLSGSLPVPIHRYSADTIDAILREYTGIGIDELSGTGMDDVIYLPEYDAYYNFTSDAGFSTFSVSHGHKSGSTVWLYEEGSGDELVLNYENGRYVFVSHLPGE